MNGAVYDLVLIFLATNGRRLNSKHFFSINPTASQCRLDITVIVAEDLMHCYKRMSQSSASKWTKRFQMGGCEMKKIVSAFISLKIAQSYLFEAIESCQRNAT